MKTYNHIYQRLLQTQKNWQAGRNQCALTTNITVRVCGSQQDVPVCIHERLQPRLTKWVLAIINRELNERRAALDRVKIKELPEPAVAGITRRVRLVQINPDAEE